MRYRRELDAMVRRFEEVDSLMADPAVICDRERFTALGKERVELESTVEAWKHYLKIERELSDNEGILAGDDEDLKALVCEDCSALRAELSAQEERLKVLLLPHDPTDDRNTIVEIRAGTGGDESSLFAADLYRMYLHYADRQGWKVELLSASVGGVGGYKEIIFQVSGKGAYGQLKFESGVHRVQRVPETESQGRIHTSAVTVAMLPEADEVVVAIRPEDLKIDTYRSGGAGGQHVNRTDSAVRLTHIPTGMVVICQDERSQHQNRAKAMDILRARLYDRMLSEQHERIASDRRSMVKTGDRSERIRTYNFPQSRVTDHRINMTLYSLEDVLMGDIDELVEGLRNQDQAQRLAAREARNGET